LAGQDETLYYNKNTALLGRASHCEVRLSHHHHAPGAHPVTVPPSLLRLSAWQRLAGAAVVIALLWVAVLWAMA